MLPAPGSSSGRSRTYASNKKKAQETPEDQLRQLQRLPPNKRCADCQSKLPQCVNLTVGTFICISCAGIHRELNNRVKGIGHSSFSTEEVERLKQTDNDKINALWLARYNPQNERMKPPQGNQNQQQLRAWIRRKYQDKAWYGGPPRGASGQQPRRGNPQQRAPPQQEQGRRTPQKRSGAPQPTMVQMPPTNQPPPQQDLLGGFSAPAPSPSASDGWDAFGGSQQQQQQQGQNFANFGGQQNDPFAQPAAPAQQQNFANFGAPPNQSQPAQQLPEQQQNNFANFAAGNTTPATPQADPFAQTTSAAATPQQGVQGFASFDQQPPPPSQQQQQQQQFGNFASFNQQQGNMNQPMQPQPGTMPTTQPTMQQPPPPQANQKNFASFGQPQQHVQVTTQQNFSPGQGSVNNTASGQASLSQSAGAFGQMQSNQQQTKPQMTVAPGGPQLNGQMMTNQQQTPGFGAFDQLQQQQEQVPVPPQQPQQPNMAASQGGMEPSMANDPKHSAFDAFDQIQAPQNQNVPSAAAQPQSGAATGLPIENQQVPPQTQDTSIMGAPKEDPMDAFAHLSVGGDSNSAPQQVETTENKPNPSQPEEPKYAANQIVCYKSNGTRSKAQIVKVHLDDDLEPFYTIKLEFGKEKQTDDAHLKHLDPLYSRLESAILGLSTEQLKSVQKFVSDLPSPLPGSVESSTPALTTPVKPESMPGIGSNTLASSTNTFSNTAQLGTDKPTSAAPAVTPQLQNSAGQQTTGQVGTAQQIPSQQATMQPQMQGLQPGMQQHNAQQQMQNQQAGIQHMPPIGQQMQGQNPGMQTPALQQQKPPVGQQMQQQQPGITQQTPQMGQQPQVQQTGMQQQMQPQQSGTQHPNQMPQMGQQTQGQHMGMQNSGMHHQLPQMGQQPAMQQPRQMQQMGQQMQAHQFGMQQQQMPQAGQQMQLQQPGMQQPNMQSQHSGMQQQMPQTGQQMQMQQPGMQQPNQIQQMGKQMQTQQSGMQQQMPQTGQQMQVQPGQMPQMGQQMQGVQPGMQPQMPQMGQQMHGRPQQSNQPSMEPQGNPFDMY